MATHTFGAFFIEVESSHTAPAAPQRAVAKNHHSIPLAREAEVLKLDSQWCNQPSGTERNVSNATVTSSNETPRVMNDLEMSRPASLINDRTDAMQSFSNPPSNRFRMLSVCLLNFCQGLSDSAPGALIPYMESHYKIGYAVVSLIFVTNAVGFILAAFFVDALRARLGRARTLMIAQTLMTCGYIPVVCTPPFPIVIVSFFFLGLGMAINLALGNVFAANLHNGTKMLGAMHKDNTLRRPGIFFFCFLSALAKHLLIGGHLQHGSYGMGGTLGPIIATAMITRGGLVWSRYYLLTLSITLFNLAFAGWAFWYYEAEQDLPSSVELTGSRQGSNVQNQAKQPSQLVSMVKAFKSKTVILGSLFIFAYQGAEVSISGWVISFLIATRHGNPSAVGYVTAGFWGGITLGRFLLSHPAHKIGEKLFVYGMVIGAAVFELLVWQIPNVIGDAVAVAIVGLLLGPVYPCATVIFSRAIGRKDQVSSLGVISAFGSSGGAVAPFTTGILAQAAGTFVLHPVAIGLFAVMLACWYSVPNIRKRTE